MGSTRVFGNSDMAVMYDGTSEEAFGVVYRGHANAERELSEFVRNWASNCNLKSTPNKTIGSLFTAYKVDRGWLDERDWVTQVETAEEVLGKEIRE